MSDQEAVQVLVALGFNQLEAEVYGLLLRESPATGYRLAQLLGKPAAGVYKAVESLARQGAVELDDGRTRLSRAVPYREVLARLERQFTDRRKRAEVVLAGIPRAGPDDRIYQLQTREQVFERCREMLARCRRIALLDVFPGALTELAREVRRAVRRRVHVAVHVYKPTTLPGATVIESPKGRLILQRWPGQWLNVVTDGKELLYAFLSADARAVRQAVWSSSAYLAWLAHSGMAGEMTASCLTQGIHTRASRAELLAALEACERLTARNAPGYGELVRRFALQEEAC